MKEFDQMMQNEGPDQMVYTDGERQRFAYIWQVARTVVLVDDHEQHSRSGNREMGASEFSSALLDGAGADLGVFNGDWRYPAHAFPGGKTVPYGRHLSADCWGGKLGTEHSGRC